VETATDNPTDNPTGKMPSTRKTATGKTATGKTATVKAESAMEMLTATDSITRNGDKLSAANKDAICGVTGSHGFLFLH
jgi:hypothetical protein